MASEGVYVTREPITLTGPSSNLELDGTLDMVRDRVDATLQVTLPVTNNLPLAALIVGAPAVGGALFLVDRCWGIGWRAMPVCITASRARGKSLRLALSNLSRSRARTWT